jgi:hypothetical protein
MTKFKHFYLKNQMLFAALTANIIIVIFVQVLDYKVIIILHSPVEISSVVMRKRLIRSTFQGCFEPEYLQNYLDEYVFRFNRRKSRSIGKKLCELFNK